MIEFERPSAILFMPADRFISRSINPRIPFFSLLSRMAFFVSRGSLGKTAKLALGRAQTVGVLPSPGRLDEKSHDSDKQSKKWNVRDLDCTYCEGWRGGGLPPRGIYEHGGIPQRQDPEHYAMGAR